MTVRWDSFVVPTDFSDGSDGRTPDGRTPDGRTPEGRTPAFIHGLKLALQSRGALMLLHVEAEGRATSWEEFPQVRETLQQWGVLSPGAAREDVAVLAGIRATKMRVAAGDPVSGVVDEVKSMDPDLVVVGTRCRRGIHRLFRRSVAEPIARRVSVPTLFLPHGHAGFVDRDTGECTLARVLIAVAPAPSAVPAVHAAATLAETLGAESVVFQLVHVGESRDCPMPQTPEIEGYSWHHVVKRGAVLETLVAAAQESAVDLIVMTTNGHDSLADEVVGSMVERVLRRAGCPVLAVPSARSV